jgi:nucleoside-diphosphate-sugar epimerase
MMNVAVTGGAGFIGSHLVDRLIADGHSVTVIDNLSTGFKRYVHAHAHFIYADINDYSQLAKSLKNIDVLYHLAAIPRIQKSIDEPITTTQTNILGTVNVLESARQNKVRRVIFTSSSSVYGDSTQMPLRETTKTNPLSPYALQKVTGEKYCKLYTELFGIETVILRLFSVYGPRQSDKQKYATVIGRFLYLARKGEPLPIFGNGKQLRDFTHIDDVVGALCKAKDIALNKWNGHLTLNICASNPTSVIDVAKMIGGTIVNFPSRKGEAQSNWGDNSRAKQILKWQPRKKLHDALHETHI